MTFTSDASTSLARLRERFAAYWTDYINRFDATALIFSFAALVASSIFSTDDSETPTTRSLRVVAVFLLWLRLFRVPLLNSSLGPYVLIFFRMLFGDLLNFLALLLVLLVAFTASWTVLLEPEPSLLAQQSSDEQNWRWTLSPVAHLETAGCAYELGGVDFFSTLKKLIEGALTGNDFFECARDSTESPWAAWALSLVFVTLTSVLLLNMLIAMCAACSHMHSATLRARVSVLSLALISARRVTTGWPRPSTTSRRRRRPTTSSSSRRGRSLFRTSRRRRHR